VYEIAILKCTLNSTDQLEQYYRDRDTMEKELTMVIKKLSWLSSPVQLQRGVKYQEKRHLP